MSNILNEHLVSNSQHIKGPGGSMSQVVGLSNNSYKPITNTVWVRARLCILQKGCTRLAAASDKVYQLLAHGRWFSPSTPASPTTKTGRHDIHVAKILLKVALNTINQSQHFYNVLQNYIGKCLCIKFDHTGFPIKLLVGSSPQMFTTVFHEIINS